MTANNKNNLELKTFEEKKNNWVQFLLKLAKKTGKSKYNDLSSNHDKYLYENK